MELIEEELVAAIEDCIAHHNDDPQPFIWTKTTEEIIEKETWSRCP